MEETRKEDNDCTRFSTSRFYGKLRPSACNRLHHQLLRVAKDVKHRRIYSEFRSGILGPPTTWKLFYRQSEAIKFAQVQGEGLMVFSFESDAIGTDGRRHFIATHPTHMWLRQREKDPEKRCTYEVIQEDAVCKLYFDLEFLYVCNPDKDGVAMTDTLITIVCHFLHREFGVVCSRMDVIDLKGTSELKFSRHLIFNIPGFAFANNYQVGNFVRMVCDKIRLWSDEKEVIEVPDISLQCVRNLGVRDSKDNGNLFLDEGVYSKNRNFRLFLSTKHGQNSPLIIAEENEYLPSHPSSVSKEEQIFYDSLITLVDSNCKILNFKGSQQCQKELKSPKSRGEKENLGFENLAFKHSPYTEIDDFIKSIIGTGHIHSWHYFSQSEVLVYNIIHYRFCHNIGREHKSNNIMYVVCLKTGTYYQKCHDPDCRDFRSESWPLPESAVFWQHMDEDEVTEWVQHLQEDSSGEERKLPEALTPPMEDISESQLMEAADAVEKWDRMDEMISSLSNSQKSLKSSQESSHSSNPWDKLSILSSPKSSSFEDLSEAQSHSINTSLRQGSEQRNHVVCEIDSDEEFLKAVHTMEKLLDGNTEVEISF